MPGHAPDRVAGDEHVSNRSGTENRKRQKVVGVWLTSDEHATLLLAAESEGKSAPAVLRDAWLDQERERGGGDG